MRIEEHVIRHFVRLLYAELSQRKRDRDLNCLPKLLDGRRRRPGRPRAL